MNITTRDELIAAINERLNAISISDPSINPVMIMMRGKMLACIDMARSSNMSPEVIDVITSTLIEMYGAAFKGAEINLGSQLQHIQDIRKMYVAYLSVSVPDSQPGA